MQQPLNLKVNGAVLSLDASGVAGTWTLSILPSASPHFDSAPFPWHFPLHNPKGNLHILSEKRKDDFAALHHRAQDRWQAPSLRGRLGDYGSGGIAKDDDPGVVDRKARSLFNNLTMEKFDSLSDQIIACANKSEMETDGRTRIRGVRLIFERATDEPLLSGTYARLCRKVFDNISQKVQDDDVLDMQGNPEAGAALFRRYLINRCQADFERRWADETLTGSTETLVLYSDSYYAAEKMRRQGRGPTRFIGELFRLKLLTERIMHLCVRQMLGNVDSPKDDNMEGLCVLLTTVGELLDRPCARAYMDVCFTCIRALSRSPSLSSRVQLMLLDVIEQRERNWRARPLVAESPALAEV
ncbi:armadillo-type protein [Schizophyllum commune]